MSLDSDVAPKRHCVQSSPTPVRKVQPINVPKHAHGMRNLRKGKWKKRKKMPSSPSSHGHLFWKMKAFLIHCHPRKKRMNLIQSGAKDTKKLIAFVVHGGSRRYCKFKWVVKRITFLTYNGTFGAIDKILAFIEQCRIWG